MAKTCRANLKELSKTDSTAAAHVISVGDREADIYELFIEAQQHQQDGTGLLVRSQHNRKLEGEEARVWNEVGSMKSCGKTTIQLPRSKGMRQREVTFSIRYKEVVLEVPVHKIKYTGASEPIRVTALELVEQGGELRRGNPMETVHNLANR